MRLQYVPNLIFTDINECESVSDRDSICTKLSTCVNTNGTYECLCIDGTRKDKNGNCTGMVNCDV